jgi:hypothetical protein
VPEVEREARGEQATKAIGTRHCETGDGKRGDQRHGGGVISCGKAEEESSQG